jgi:hypothetical protein
MSKVTEMIFCDAYGAYINPFQCENCKIKKDCFKIKLPKSQISEIKDLDYKHLNFLLK